MAAKDSSVVESTQILSAAKAVNHLGVSIYQKLASEGKNVFFSPLSLSSALAILFCGAKNETSKEMRHALGYNSANIKDEEVESCFRCLQSTLDKSPDSYLLTSANVVFSQNDFAIKHAFKVLLEQSFNAMVREVDFRNKSVEAVQEANNWVKEKTKGMIPNLLESLDPDTVMVILNAVYFKGFWLHTFQKHDTYSKNFYNKGLEKNVKPVDMMHIKEYFPFVANKSFKALQLPYKGEEICMMILLPNNRTGLSKLESKITPDFIEDLNAELCGCEVDVTLPKFRLEYSKSLKGQFQNLGMIRAFYRGANLGNINDSPDLLVSDIAHKAVLVVNEEGSEAAAATAVTIRATCFRETPEFVADHPFLFLIYNAEKNLILFMGKVEEL